MKYASVYRDSLNCNIWYDHENGSYFSAAQTIATPQSGKHHSFIMDRAKFLCADFSGAPNLSNMGNSYYHLKNAFLDIPAVATPELRCGFNDCIKEIKDQESVFIVGGGPSTSKINFSEYKHIPKWIMNKFFDNDKLKNLENIQLVTFLDDVNLENKDLWDFMSTKKPILLQEFSDPKFGNSRINFLKSKYENLSYYMTRYRSRIGVGARLTILSILLGVKNIYISGLDGYDVSSQINHAFEENKNLPAWLRASGPYLQKQQFVLFWDYILNELRKSFDFKIHDLSKDQDTVQYKFMKEYIK